MPFIRLTTNIKLDDSKREQLKTAVFDAITRIPGKTEEVTMLDIIDDAAMSKGNNTIPAAFVDTRVFTAAPQEGKDEYCKALGDALNTIIGVDKKMLYVNILEFNGWGSGFGFRIL